MLFAYMNRSDARGWTAVNAPTIPRWRWPAGCPHQPAGTTANRAPACIDPSSRHPVVVTVRISSAIVHLTRGVTELALETRANPDKQTPQTPS